MWGSTREPPDIFKSLRRSGGWGVVNAFGRWPGSSGVGSQEVEEFRKEFEKKEQRKLQLELEIMMTQVQVWRMQESGVDFV